MLLEPLPDDLSRPRFLVADALSLGVRPHRLRTLELRTPHSGLRSLGPEPRSVLERCRDFAPLLTSTQCFSHVTAALLWRLPVPVESLDGALHVTAFHHTREPRRPGIVGHRSEDVLTMRHLDLPVVTPLRAWAQCAETFSIDDLVAMGDALLSKWSPYAPARYRTRRQLDEVARRWAGRRGAAGLNEALALVRPFCWSPKESQLRLEIVRAGCLEPPQLNQKMYAADGQYLGRPDLAYEPLRIGIEYEGDYHRTSADTFRRDIIRRERFADAGWKTIHITEQDLQTAARLRLRLRRLLPLTHDN